MYHLLRHHLTTGLVLTTERAALSYQIDAYIVVSTRFRGRFSKFPKTVFDNNNEGIFIALLHEVSQRLTLLPLLIRRINHSWNHLSSLGSIQLNCCQLCPHRYPFTPGWREAIMVNCLAQGHKHHGRGSNPHSDDSAIRTQIQCTKPLGHGTPWFV